MKGLEFKEGKELSQGQSQVSVTPSQPTSHDTLGVLGSLRALLSFLSSLMEEFLVLSFVPNLNLGLTPFTFPWIPGCLGKIQAFPIKHSAFESSQAAGLMQLMVPNCWATCSLPLSFSAVLGKTDCKVNHASTQ